MLQRDEHRVGACRIRVDQEISRVELQQHARQRRPETVVQITSQAAPLLLARGHETFARALEIARQACSVRGDRGLTGQVDEQPAVGLGEVALADRQAPDGHAGVAERHGRQLARWSSLRGGRLERPVVLEIDRGVRHAERSPRGVDHELERRRVRRSHPELAPEVRQLDVRISGAPPEPDIDRVLEPPPQRAEHDRDADRGDQRDREPRAAVERGADHEQHHGRVGTDEHRRHGAVDEAPCHEAIQVVQAVAEDRDADRDGNRHERAEHRATEHDPAPVGADEPDRPREHGEDGTARQRGDEADELSPLEAPRATQPADQRDARRDDESQEDDRGDDRDPLLRLHEAQGERVADRVERSRERVGREPVVRARKHEAREHQPEDRPAPARRGQPAVGEEQCDEHDPDDDLATEPARVRHDRSRVRPGQPLRTDEDPVHGVLLHQRAQGRGDADAEQDPADRVLRSAGRDDRPDERIRQGRAAGEELRA